MTFGRTTSLACLTTAAAALLCGPSTAEPRSPGPDRIAQEQAVQRLAASGYTGVTKLSDGADYWEAMAVKDGRIVTLRVDPRSGAASDLVDDDE